MNFFYRLLVCVATAGLLAVVPLGAAVKGSILVADGVVHTGDVWLENGVQVRSAVTGQVLRFELGSVLRLVCGVPLGEEVQKGVVLVDGTRLAGAFTFGLGREARFTGRPFRIPGEQVAWLVHSPFVPRLASGPPAGKTGALLPGGDFFEGPIKAADEGAARVLNAVFGPKTFRAGSGDALAIVLRELRPGPAVLLLTMQDGSRYPVLDTAVREGGSLALRHPTLGAFTVGLPEVAELRAGSHRLLALDGTPPFQTTGELKQGPLKLGESMVPGIALGPGASAVWTLPAGNVIFTCRMEAPASVGNLALLLAVDEQAPLRLPVKAEGIQRLTAPLPAGRSVKVQVEGATGVTTLADAALIRR